MMIASVLRLNRRDVQALRINDAYSLHRVVYDLYDDVRSVVEKTASKSSGILYADQGGDARGRNILLLADRQPAATTQGGHGEVESRPIADDFLEHEHYRFKVIINPTRRDSASRKLVPVRERKAIADWFEQRSQTSWGFVVETEHLQVDRVEVQQFAHKSGRQITIAQAHLQGVLRVTDRDRFIASFTNGIGRARAYGCGLLQIVPLNSHPFAC